MLENWNRLSERSPQFVAKFNADKGLPQSVKDEFMHLIDDIADPANLLQKCERICHQFKLRCESTCGGLDHAFGHLERLERLRERLIDLIGDVLAADNALEVFINSQGLVSQDYLDRVEEFLRTSVDPCNFINTTDSPLTTMATFGREDIRPDELEALKEELSLSDARVVEWLSWSFELNGYDDDYWIDHIVELPCRLGLPGHGDIEQVEDNVEGAFCLIKYALDEGHVLHKPTVLDAGIGFAENFFVPGGKTKPHEECVDLGGLDEWVHWSPTFGEIDYSIYE